MSLELIKNLKAKEFIIDVLIIFQNKQIIHLLLIFN